MRDKGYRGLPARDARRVLSSRFRKLSRQLRQVTRTKPAKQAGCTHAHVRARQRGNCLLHHPRIAPSGDARSLIRLRIIMIIQLRSRYSASNSRC